MGQVLQAGAGQAPARQALLRAGLADTTSATTINRVCGSGLKSIMLAAADIRAGDADVVVAGGMESMNQAPFLLRKARFGYRLGNGDAGRRRPSSTACGARSRTATWAPTPSGSRSRTTSAARTRTRSRSTSHQHAVAAIDAGRFDAELAPVTVRDAKGRETVVAVDEGPRRDTTARGAREAAARLRPARRRGSRRRRRSGTVTAGNAPGSRTAPPRRSSPASAPSSGSASSPLARIVGYAQAEVAPKWLFLAPIAGRPRPAATGSSCRSTPSTSIEINEAFAAQALADGRELGFDWSKVNVNGGAIALGHPIGASGARIVATLLHELSAAAGPLRAGDAVPRRRRLGRDGVRAGLSAGSTASRRVRSRLAPSALAAWLRSSSQPLPTPQPGGTTPSRPSLVATAGDLPRLEDEAATVACKHGARRAAQVRVGWGIGSRRPRGDPSGSPIRRVSSRDDRAAATAGPPSARPSPRTSCSSPGSGCDRRRGATFESLNPADTRDVVGRFQAGDAADVAMADPRRRDRRPDVARDPGARSAARSCTRSAR